MKRRNNYQNRNSFPPWIVFNKCINCTSFDWSFNLLFIFYHFCFMSKSVLYWIWEAMIPIIQMYSGFFDDFGALSLSFWGFVPEFSSSMARKNRDNFRKSTNFSEKSKTFSKKSNDIIMIENFPAFFELGIFFGNQIWLVLRYVPRSPHLKFVKKTIAVLWCYATTKFN